MIYNHKDGVSLRKLARSELGDLFRLKQESWWGTHNILIMNLEDQEKWFENIPSNQLFMIAKLRRQFKDASWSSTDVGVAVYTDIDWVNRSLNISGSIYKSYRKPEITKPAFSAGLDFAFEILNMNRVGAEVLDYNRPAQMLEIGHLKFEVEGVRRQAVYKCGRYYNSIMLSLLREEWAKQDRVQAYGGSCNEDFNSALAGYCRDRWALTNQSHEAIGRLLAEDQPS